jgi:hypothetical protein
MEKESAAITGDVIRATAPKLWEQLPQYKDFPQPKLSTGWLDNFKRCFSIRQHTRHGEAGSLNTNNVSDQLEDLHQRLRRYGNNDIYNMDETALFWETIPDRTLATLQMAGFNAAKSRMTANFCCNSFGTDKLPIWYIGMSAKPRCFASSGVDMSSLQMVCRSNKKG